jgi:hypothetical protein
VIFFLVVLIASAVAVPARNRRRVMVIQGNVKLIQVDGRVTVNGTSASSGATVSSDSTIETAAKSSAVVSLGKLGRVEVLPETKLVLRYDDSSISILLDSGGVRIPKGHLFATTTLVNRPMK